MHKIAIILLLATVYFVVYGADTSVPAGFENYTQEFKLVNQVILNMPLIKRVPLFFSLLLFERSYGQSLQGLDAQAYDQRIAELVQEFKTSCNIEKVAQKHVELADYFSWPTVRAVLVEIVVTLRALRGPIGEIHNEAFIAAVNNRLQEKRRLAKDVYFDLWYKKGGVVEKNVNIPYFNGVSCAELFCCAKSKSRLHKLSVGLAEIKLHGQHLNDMNGIASFPRPHMCQTLRLADNRLQQLVPLPTFTNLTTIHLNNNQLRAFPHELKDLPALQILILAANNISKIPTNIQGFTKLVGLNLSQNGIQELPDAIEGLGVLQELILDHNEISCFKGVPWGMRELLKLDLNYNPIIHIHEASALKMGVVEELAMKGCLITPQAIVALQNGVEKVRGQDSLRIAYKSSSVTE